MVLAIDSAHLTTMKTCFLLLVFATAGITARAVCPPHQCGFQINMTSGWKLLGTPGFPNYYPYGLDCLWAITSPPSTTIRLQCYYFDIWCNGVNGDLFLYSLSGDCAMSDSYWYCGGNGYLDVNSMANYFAVHFYSQNYLNNRYGFLCNASVVDQNPPVTTTPSQTATTTTPLQTATTTTPLQTATTTTPLQTATTTTPLQTATTTTPLQTATTTTPLQTATTTTPLQTATTTTPLQTAATTTPSQTAATTQSNGDCLCGNKGGARIVGGNEASDKEWPWQVALSVNIDSVVFFCGGSLISKDWVVTAAHCVDPFVSNDIFVYFGKNNIDDYTLADAIKVDAKFVHENYDSNTVNNDIALLQLTTSDIAVTPICLPFQETDNDLQDELGTVTGWGTLQSGGALSDILMEVKLPIVSTSACKTDYQIVNGQITDNMICTYELGKDACQGDSGGPLTFTKDERYILVGLVSFGHGCGDENSPGVYAKVANYLDWIKTITNEQFCFDP